MITGMPRIAIAVADFAAAIDTFRDRLGMPVLDVSESSVESLGARLAMCVPPGGSNIEIMSPAKPDAPLSQSLQKFLDRRGDGLFALMLEAPVPDEEAATLASRGLHVLPLMAGAGGRDIHPASTHGVLIRVYPVNSFTGSAAAPSADTGLSGIERVIIAVRDIEQAANVYGAGLGLASTAIAEDPGRGVRSALVTPGTGGLIELVAVVDATRPFAQKIDAFLGSRQEGMYALVLKSADPGATCATLSARGLSVSPADDSPGTFEVGRESAFGALLRIEPSA
jgi:catechol 2,3-dioxygenase-like lactoylglutathione lyase family enzyme